MTTKDDKNDASPLKRYLARQKGGGETGGPQHHEMGRAGESEAGEDTASARSKFRTSSSEVKATPSRFSFSQEEAAAAPTAPPPEAVRPGVGESLSPSVAPSAAPATSRISSRFAPTDAETRTMTFQAGGFWSRFFAYMIDLLLLHTCSGLISGAAIVITMFIPFVYVSPSLARHQVLVWILSWFYFGYFYSKKGASPGKMLMQLEIVETGSGRRLGYARSFFRETVGKYFSAALLGFGFFLSAFRADKKALHDLIFDTRVVVGRARS